jgi:transposase
VVQSPLISVRVNYSFKNAGLDVLSYSQINVFYYLHYFSLEKQLEMGYKPRTNRRETSPGKREAIWALYKAGHSIASISTLEDIPPSTARSIINRRLKRNEDDFTNLPRSGAPQILSIRAKRALVRHAAKNPREGLQSLQTPSKSASYIGVDLVRKTLKEAGKVKRKPRKKPFLKPAHKKVRFLWCRVQRRSKRRWDRVCWSDEATFEVGEDTSLFYVTRGVGIKEAYKEEFLKPSFKSGRTAVGVWSCFMGTEMGPLVIIEKGGRMTGKKYLETLKDHFVPFYERMRAKYGDEVVMQQDNAPWHTAKVCQRYLEEHNVQLLRWPPQSPDLTPIENVWAWVKKRISRERHNIRNVAAMELQLMIQWPRIDPEYLAKLNASMPDRIQDCIKNRGGSTKY